MDFDEIVWEIPYTALSQRNSRSHPLWRMHFYRVCSMLRRYDVRVCNISVTFSTLLLTKASSSSVPALDYKLASRPKVATLSSNLTY